MWSRISGFWQEKDKFGWNIEFEGTWLAPEEAKEKIGNKFLQSGNSLYYKMFGHLLD